MINKINTVIVYIMSSVREVVVVTPPIGGKKNENVRES